MNRSMHSNISPVLSIAPQALAADVDGAGVDLRGYDAAMVVIEVGIFTYSGTNKMEWKLEDSDDNSTFAAVEQADVKGATVTTGGIVHTDAADVTAIKTVTLSYVGDKRYIRVVADQSGTTTTAMGAAVVLRGLPANRPVA